MFKISSFSSNKRIYLTDYIWISEYSPTGNQPAKVTAVMNRLTTRGGWLLFISVSVWGISVLLSSFRLPLHLDDASLHSHHNLHSWCDCRAAKHSTAGRREYSLLLFFHFYSLFLNSVFGVHVWLDYTCFMALCCPWIGLQSADTFPQQQVCSYKLLPDRIWGWTATSSAWIIAP